MASDDVAGLVSEASEWVATAKSVFYDTPKARRLLAGLAAALESVACERDEWLATSDRLQSELGRLRTAGVTYTRCTYCGKQVPAGRETCPVCGGEVGL